MKKNFIVKWCKKCILPNTRPNLFIFGDGLCSICSLKKTVLTLINENENSKLRNFIKTQKL